MLLTEKARARASGTYMIHVYMYSLVHTKQPTTPQKTHAPARIVVIWIGQNLTEEVEVGKL